MQTKINAFWDWFQENEQAYFDLQLGDPKQEQLFQDLMQEFRKLDEHLAFEFSMPLEDGRREFVLTAQGMQKSFPVVFQLHEQAPEMPHWIIVPLKPRLNQDLMLNIGEVEFGFDDMFFRWAKDEDKIALQVHLRGEFPDNLRIQLGFLMLDVLLGEYDVATRIGHLEFVQLEETEIENLSTIRDLPGLIDDIYYAEED
jgi:hypothetical protein